MPTNTRTLIALASLFATLVATQAQTLDTQNLALNFSAAQDPLGDNLWTDAVSGSLALTFPAVPIRAEIDSPVYPAIVAGYGDGATGLTNFFDQGSPIRSLNDATFELWIDISTLAGGNDQVIFEAGGSTRGISLTLSGAQLRFNVKGDAAEDIVVATDVALGLRHVVAVIRCTNDDLANDAVELYVDGLLVGKRTTSS